MGICQVPKIVIGSKNTEQGSLKIYGKNADAITLGDATHEGGDISVYRDTSGDKQFELNADAASNALAMSVYGGVVAQNYLTVGQAALNGSYNFYVLGGTFLNGDVSVAGLVRTHVINSRTNNVSEMRVNITVADTDATDHAIKLQIDENDILEVKATGNSSGGIDTATKAIGLYGTTPATQHAAIGDPAESIAGNNAAIDSILAALRAIGLIAT